MKKLFLSDGSFALVDDKDFKSLSKYSWHPTKNGYAIRNQVVGEYEDVRNRKKVLLHRHILSGVKFVDHINGDRRDCRRKNLRECTAGQNQWNSKTPKNNTSGYKGVSFRKDRNRFRAQISCNGKTYRLGSFLSAKKAAKAYDLAAKELHGKYARLNFGGRNF